MLLVPALALAAPAFAQVRPATLSDSQEPGSVIVFPKFIQGSVSTPEGSNQPITELEIGVVCPKGSICPEHMPVKIKFHWVCGATQADIFTSFICKETDFDIPATVFEKIVLTPTGEAPGFYAPGLPSRFAPAPECPQRGGYLIAWVVNTSDQAIKFDGLVGDAHLRPGSVNGLFLGGPTALADYTAIPIQAAPHLATGALVDTNGNGALMFDGADGPAKPAGPGFHYQMVTGQVIGDVRYTNTAVGPTFTLGALTLLTLDVKSNRPNPATFVDLDFFGGNPSTIGNENQLSTSTEFICWEEIALTNISSALVTTQMGRKGVFVSAPAVTADGTAVTLLGLSEVLEGGVFPPVAAWPRASLTGLFNSSNPVATRFVPTRSPNFLQ
jgi:hypothetical protein